MAKNMSKYHLKTIRDTFVVIILTIFLILVASKAFGQSYGFNGTNVPENLTSEVRQWIIDMHPVGDTVVMVFRNDKYETCAPLEDINNVIALNDELIEQGRYLSIIYTFNTRGVSIADNFYAFDLFRIAGVDIMAGRLGNETYFKAAGFNGDWATYWSFAAPVRDALLAYSVPILIPIATPENTRWNTPAAEVINSSPIYGVDFHFYYGRNDLAVYRDTSYVVNDALKKRTNTAGYADFYETVYEQITTSTLLQDVMAWFYDEFPNKEMYVTEWGAGGNVGGMGGTVGFEAANDWFLNQISGYSHIRAICKFNGASITGFITPTGKLDISTEPYIKRLGYYTLTNFYQSADSLTLGLKQSVHNLTPDTLFFNRQGYTATFTGITGNWDASSGACAWWASNSVKSYEISGTATLPYAPPMSYGYVSYHPNKGCTDPTAINYNPDAIENDRSCIYPVQECYRKRWLFTSLPCRAVKSNCNCSPTKL